MNLIEIFTVGFMALAIPISWATPVMSPGEIASLEGGDYDEETHP